MEPEELEMDCDCRQDFDERVPGSFEHLLGSNCIVVSNSVDLEDDEMAFYGF